MLMHLSGNMIERRINGHSILVEITCSMSASCYPRVGSWMLAVKKHYYKKKETTLMGDETEEYNFKFFEWANKNGVDLEHKEDWIDWWTCWADGYSNGVEDVKEVIRST